MSEIVYTYNRKHWLLWLNLMKAVLLTIFLAVAGPLIFFGVHFAAGETEGVEAKMAKSEKIDPRGPAVVVFNRPVAAADIDGEIMLLPATKATFKWSEKNQKLEVTPGKFFDPGQKYEIKISLREGLLKNKVRKQALFFRVEDFPEVEKVVPGKDEESISIDSDFKIKFEKSTRGYDLDFEINPFDDFRHETNAEKDEVRIYSEKKLKYETEYWVRITARLAADNPDAPRKEIFLGKFKTEKKPYAAPPKNNSAVIPEDQVVDREARKKEGKYIDINLAKQHLSVFEDGKLLGTYRISTGKRGMATPTGNFKIMAKRGRAWSKKYKLYMPYFMQFTGVGHGIHELPEWPGGYKEGAAHLGIPVSHGCVRLGIGPAESVYGWAEVGTAVVIH